MNIGRPLTSAFLSLLILVAVMWSVPVQAQEEVSPPESVEGGTESKPIETDPSLTSDSERLLRYTRVMELDQAKLEQVRRDLEEQQELAERVGTLTYELVTELEEKNQQLRDLDGSEDPATRSDLEAEIRDLEMDLELYKAQSDLELTTGTTLRQQMASLEKKLERQQRAIDTLRGVGPTTPKPAAPPEAEAAAKGLGSPSVPMPGVHAVSDGGAVATPATTKPRLETTAQVEAQRALERKMAAVEEAEGAVVEYVKRRESLQEQVEFETVLLETTEKSVENLEKAAQRWQDQAARRRDAGADAAEIEKLERGAEGITAALEKRQDIIEERHEYLASLEGRLEAQQLEESLVTEELEARRQEVKRAQERVYWLESPIHPSNVSRWFRERGPRILFVIVAAAVLLFLLKVSARTVARLTVRKRRGDRAPTVKRADTLALSFRSAATLLIVVGGIILVLQEAGIDVKTVLGGAAILGFALAFGAQNLMRDYFTGFMILLEDQYELGDLVSIGDVTGRVEMVNMRTTMLRDLEGRVHFIPNGEVKSVTNRSYLLKLLLLKNY